MCHDERRCIMTHTRFFGRRMGVTPGAVLFIIFFSQIFKHDSPIYNFVGENESPLLKIIDSIGGENKIKIESRHSECNDRKYCPIEAIEAELSARYKQILDKEASFELVTDLKGIFMLRKIKFIA